MKIDDHDDEAPRALTRQERIEAHGFWSEQRAQRRACPRLSKLIDDMFLVEVELVPGSATHDLWGGIVVQLSAALQELREIDPVLEAQIRERWTVPLLGRTA